MCFSLSAYLFSQCTFISFCLWFLISICFSKLFSLILFIRLWHGSVSFLHIISFHSSLSTIFFSLSHLLSLILLSSSFSVPFSLPFPPPNSSSRLLFLTEPIIFFSLETCAFFSLILQPDFSYLCLFFFFLHPFVCFYTCWHILKCTRMW